MKSKDLTQLVQPGQPVEFIVSASSHDKVKHKGGRAPKYLARQASTCFYAASVLILCIVRHMHHSA